MTELRKRKSKRFRTLAEREQAAHERALRKLARERGDAPRWPSPFRRDKDTI